MSTAVEDAVKGTGRKLGGIPLWGWAIGAVGGYFLYRRFAVGTAAATAPTAADASSSSGPAPASSSPEVYDPQTGAVYDPQTGAFASAAVPGVSNTYGLATNAQWASTAANGLVAAGQSPATVSNALAAYLGGAQLTPAEVAVVQAAVSTYGVPPGGVLPINAAPVKVPTPTHTPTPVHRPTPTHTPTPVHRPAPRPKSKAPGHSYSTYRIRSGDTLTSIAQKYYGHATKTEIDAIAHASGISNPNVIYAGHELKIPHNV